MKKIDFLFPVVSFARLSSYFIFKERKIEFCNKKKFDHQFFLKMNKKNLKKEKLSFEK